jgi:rhomboid protease GluP
METEATPEVLRLTFRRPAYWTGALLLVVVVCALGVMSLVQVGRPILKGNLILALMLFCGCAVTLALRKIRLPKLVPPIELGPSSFVLPVAADSGRTVRLDYGDLRALSLRQRGSQQLLIVETTRGLFMYPQGAFDDPRAIERFLAGLRERISALPTSADVLEVMAKREETIRRVLEIRPLATYAILGTLLIGLAAQVFSNGFFDDGDSLRITALGANVAALVRAGEWWRLVTAAFLHGGFLHIFINGLTLIMVGQIVERITGPWRLVIIYVVSCVVGAATSAMASRSGISVGASTGIFGILGALAVCNWFYRRELAFGFKQPVDLWVFNLALNAALPVLFPLIDIWAHVGGFVAGGLTALALIAPYPQLVYNRPTGPLVRAVAVALVGVSALAIAMAMRNALTDQTDHVLAVAEASDRDGWMNAVAWEVARQPEPKPDQLVKAVRIADRAVQLAPSDLERAVTRDTYATLLYRSARVDEAIDQEDESLRVIKSLAAEGRIEATMQQTVLASQMARFLDARVKTKGVRVDGIAPGAVALELMGQGLRVRLSDDAPHGLVIYGILKRGSAREGLFRLAFGSDRSKEHEHTIPLSSAVVRGADEVRVEGLDISVAWIDARDCHCSPSTYEVRMWPHDSSIDGYP